MFVSPSAIFSYDTSTDILQVHTSNNANAGSYDLALVAEDAGSNLGGIIYFTYVLRCLLTSITP